jgi:hypothetical protein
VQNIKLDLGEIGEIGVDCICLTQDRDMCRALVNAVMNLRIPYNGGKLSNGFTTGILASSAHLRRVNES